MGAENTKTKLPQDSDSQAIQVLAADDSTVAELSIGAANTRTTLPSGAEIIEVTVTGACRFATGTSSVDATGKKALNPGTYIYRVKGPLQPPDPAPTHFAVIQIGAATGICTVVRLF